MAAKLSPSKKQLDWQKMELTAFIHYGMNTFTDRGWGSGTETPSQFTPTKVDVNQWVTTLKNAGFKLIILTVKHHDGFCLWHTKTTKHSVEYSPYKNDIAKEFAEACRAQGMKVGFYLSPWDMNAKSYGKGEEYNDFFTEQLTELLTQYGTVDEIWLDGAKDEKYHKKQEYDFTRWMDLINKLQPNCITANLGLDARWAGNEGGYAREAEWSAQAYKPAAYMDAAYNEKYGLKEEDQDLGSRNILKKVPALFWFPAEVDVSIRAPTAAAPGDNVWDQWFFHAGRQRVRTLTELLDIYYKSVGINANLLLNFPVNKDGVIPAEDINRINEFKNYLNNTFSKGFFKDKNTSWINVNNGKSKEYKLSSKTQVNVLVIQEDISKGQRVESFSIQYYNSADSTWKDVTLAQISKKTETIGYKRIIKFNTVTTDKIKITINETRLPANITSVNVYYSANY